MGQHLGVIDPGWYPDPKGIPQERYWDGSTWTYRVRPMTITLPAKAAPTSKPDPAPGTPESE